MLAPFFKYLSGAFCLAIGYTCMAFPSQATVATVIVPDLASYSISFPSGMTSSIYPVTNTVQVTYGSPINNNVTYRLGADTDTTRPRQ